MDFSLINETLNIKISILDIVKYLGVPGFIGFYFRVDLFRLLAKVSKVFNRKYAVFEMNSVINIIRKDRVLSDLESERKRKIKYQFHKEIHSEELDDGETITIVMNSTKHTPKNVAKSTVQYISLGVVKDSSHVINESLKQALVLSLTRKYLKENRLMEPANFFDKNMLPKLFQENKKLETIMENLRSIDAVGLLTRVLVKQIHEVCKLEVESLNYTELKRETEHFYQFIHKIANRKEYERVPLKFNRP